MCGGGSAIHCIGDDPIVLERVKMPGELVDPGRISDDQRLYGPGDNFHPTDSHVILGMMRRFHEAKVAGDRQVVVWGSGTPHREFLHVDDLAMALYRLVQVYEEPQTINVGTGEDVTIAELAALMKAATGLTAEITFDRSKPDGTPRKLLDVRRIHALGWRPKTPLAAGLAETYRWAVEHVFAPEGVGVRA